MNTYYENLTNQFPVTKTLRNELRPIGKTLDFIKERELISIDEKRKANYAKVKIILDNYHKMVIATTLERASLPKQILQETFDLYNIQKKTDADTKKYDNNLGILRKNIADTLCGFEDFSILFKQDLFTKKLPEFAKGEDLSAVKSFERFTTYFKGYNEVRANLYSSENKSQTVPYRLINENMPKYFDNVKAYKRVKEAGLTAETFSEEETDFCFMVENYSQFLTQKGINNYNAVIGELNSAVNLYNQSHSKDASFKKVPKLVVLFKQILSDREDTFIPEFSNDDELLSNLECFDANFMAFIHSKELKSFLKTLSDSKGENVFVKNDTSITSFSKLVLDSWNSINQLLSDDYDVNYSGKKKGEKYEEEKEKAFKQIKSYKISDIESLTDKNLIEAYIAILNENIDAISKCSSEFSMVVLNEHDRDKSFSKNNKAVDTTKAYLDSIKDFEKNLKLITGTGLESDKNVYVYSELDYVLSEVKNVDSLYNMVRNYVTQKPFSTEKFKLNFNCPTFLNGWDRNKEKNNLGVLLMKDNKYYLGIMDINSRNVFNVTNIIDKNEEVFDKITYKQIPDVAKYLSSKQIIPQNPPEEIVKILRKKSADSKSLTQKEVELFITYLKDDFLVNYPCILDENGNNYFNFNFRKANEYNSLNEFFEDVKRQAYSIKTVPFSARYIENLVDTGKLYLFEIYNADFSPFAKGNLNLHTVYFKMLFDERNLKEVVYKLNGEAEVFYRPASIEKAEIIIHKAGETLQNKNKARAEIKPDSVFNYDIVKDKRYTEDKFFIHLPITMNCNAPGLSTFDFNVAINKSIYNTDGVNVIGIDRGERNLLYVVVIDQNGKLLEQISLNEIINNEYKTDYHSLLKSKSDERIKSRQDWKTIENIKNLKEGYLSQVVNIIVKLTIKYNAVICLEALNSGFKRTRSAFEFSVYQKFEKMLIDKLNYVVIDKSRSLANVENIGGALSAIQLTPKVANYTEMRSQTGIIYYVPAAYTSKIDPITGFINLFNIKYENTEKAKAFVEKFDSIVFNAKENYFEFSFDYNNFTYKAEGTNSKWVVCSHGDRIATFRNPEKNNMWDTKVVIPTDEFKALFSKYDVDINDIKSEIIKRNEPALYKEFLYLFKLVLQMRNSDASTKEDYIISPVKSEVGIFYDSRTCENTLPKDADANGAYNIARKGLWIINQIKQCDDFTTKGAIRYSMSNKEWFKYVQK